MVDDSHRARLTRKQRIVLHALKIGMSEDGLRWTAPRRSRAIVEKAFRQATLLHWQEGSKAEIIETDDGLVFDYPDGRMELRWLD